MNRVVPSWRHPVFLSAWWPVLAGHPEHEELLEDLDDHLAQIAAESDAPLGERPK
ncbi:hypothetical protein AB0H88_39465 [Nonomuraea sp. NPDC050680]|uniref:hypothetical protein n=1 Tax=Nonomuraea sp. NPDC050680 TaxID=3154630 RepID=UPI00340CA397